MEISKRRGWVETGARARARDGPLRETDRPPRERAHPHPGQIAPAALYTAAGVQTPGGKRAAAAVHFAGLPPDGFPRADRPAPLRPPPSPVGGTRVIAPAHTRYFHNWSGNRVTCRDWFQLTLKEGLTVFRDQHFTEDMTSRAVKRIDDVRVMRSAQFAQDAGPMAHPIRPESYRRPAPKSSRRD